MRFRDEILEVAWYLGIAIVSAAILLVGAHLLTGLSFGKEPCEFTVARHERHTTTAQKRAVFQKAGVPYDAKHRPFYVVDHVIPLELGGLDEVSNMQLQGKVEGHLKDLVENALAACVCKGLTPLPVAQKAVAKWKEVKLGTCPKE